MASLPQVRSLLRALKNRVAGSRGPNRLQTDPESGPPGSMYAPFGHELWVPWDDPEWRTVRETALRATTLTADRLWTLEQLTRQAAPGAGTFVECGVFRGGSALVLKEVLEQHGSDGMLWLFDAFSGLPRPGREDSSAWKGGEFAETSEQAVRSLLGSSRVEVAIVPGWLPESLGAIPSQLGIDLVHLDLDLYEPTLACLEYLVPKLKPGGVLVVDDFGFPSCPGVRAAVEKAWNPSELLGHYSPTGQFIGIRRPGELTAGPG